MQIYALHEGIFIATEGHALIPYSPDCAQPLPAEIVGKRKITVGVCPFLIKEGKDLFLLDTGLGFYAGAHRLWDNLARLGISPHEVSAIFFSHLHHDHIGGAFQEDHSFLFPNATLIMHADHLAFILEKGTDIEREKAALLQQSSRLIYLTGEQGFIPDYPYIHYGISHGHCPFHTHFLIHRQRRGPVFYGGDEASQQMQMKIHFAAKYDYDGKEADRLRKLWWEKGKAEDWTFLFFHDLRDTIFSFH